MKLIYLKSALKFDSFHVAIGIKIPFFRVLVTIEPGRSLQQFVTTSCLTAKQIIGVFWAIDKYPFLVFWWGGGVNLESKILEEKP